MAEARSTEPAGAEPAQGAGEERSWGTWLAVVVLAGAVLTFLCHELLLTVFVVHGQSMEPTLHHGQRVLVLRPLGEISRGDLLVFRNPHASDEVLIKRVLALPGETLKVEAGRLLVDGLHRPEPYVKPGTALLKLAQERCPPDTYYLLGDNRAESFDSRKLGPIERRLLLGKVIHRF